MRLGLESAGCECVFSSDWDAPAQTTYAENFGERPHGDIRAIASSEIPDHDILAAGFPCQPFSISGVSKKNSLGRAHGFRDQTQATLFFEVKRIIHDRRPAAFLLENVKNLMSHDRGRTFAIILRSLEEDLGYHVEYRVMDAARFVPQHRERVYLVGFREPRSFNWPALPTKATAIAEILEAPVDPKYTLSDRLWSYLQDYARKHRAAGNGFGFGLVAKNGISRTLSARYYKDGSEILIPQGRANPRRLTPRECARLMGFADSFKIPVSDTQAYKQFGNSVVVPLVAALANQIVRALIAPVAHAPKQMRLLRSAP